MNKSKPKNKPKIETVAYIPEDAEMNYTNSNGAPPKTEYEKRRKIFRRKEVKDLTKGKYGRDE